MGIRLLSSGLPSLTSFHKVRHIQWERSNSGAKQNAPPLGRGVRVFRGEMAS